LAQNRLLSAHSWAQEGQRTMGITNLSAKKGFQRSALSDQPVRGRPRPGEKLQAASCKLMADGYLLFFRRS
jgi:hypothetical protein